MKVWSIAGTALLLTGCGTHYYNAPDSPPATASERPIYQVDDKSGEFKRDRRAERIREQGSADGSTDQGATFGW